MGRPSLAPQRRAELLDATIEAILERGVDGATVARIADIAGVQPSLVHHYLGQRHQILEAAVQRAVDTVESLVAGRLEAVAAPDGRLVAQLDVLFSERLAAPEINQLIDQLVAAGYVDPVIRDAVSAMYARFRQILDDTLRAAFPDADAYLVTTVAHGLLALAHAAPTFGFLGFDPANLRRARAAADRLVAQLRPAPPTAERA